MALTAEEQELLDFAAAGLPPWFTSDERAMEHLGALAKVMGATKILGSYWFTNALILSAVGAILDDPDWLNQHAIDRGTGRQDGETDAALRDRLRNVPDALTLPTLLASAQSIVDAEGIVGTVAILELARDGGHFLVLVSDTAADGGEFFDAGGGTFEFEPTTPFAAPDLLTGGDLVVSLASAGANNGTFSITALNDNRAQFVNVGAVGVDLGATWVHVKRHKVGGEVIDGFRSAFMDRGYRFGAPVSTLVVILPFGCTAGTVAAVEEMLRQKKGAGVAAVVECRLVP